MITGSHYMSDLKLILQESDCDETFYVTDDSMKGSVQPYVAVRIGEMLARDCPFPSALLVFTDVFWQKG